MISIITNKRLAAMAVLFALMTLPACAQQVALKTNLLYDAAMTPNVGLEVGVNKKHTM